MPVQALRPSNRDKLAYLPAAKLVASFGLKFGEKFASLFFSAFEKKSLSWSVQKVCRKLPGGHGRVFLADRGQGIGIRMVKALSEGRQDMYHTTY
jgi:hypothetical protein